MLVDAFKTECEKVEGILWTGILSRTRLREFVDARKRIVGMYCALSKEQKFSAFAKVVGLDRTTLIYYRGSHEALLAGDWIYRKRYALVLKAVEDRMQILKANYINTQLSTQNTQETMFTSTISGKLGRDAEVITLRDKSYYKLNVAVEGRGKDAPTTWVQVLYYKSENSRLGGMLLKGAGIVAQGRLDVKAYAKKDGSAAADISLWADTLEMTKYADAAAAPATTEGDDDIF